MYDYGGNEKWEGVKRMRSDKTLIGGLEIERA
jgi:hypothetical protein